MMQFEVSLVDLRFHAFHGVDPQERIVGNEFAVTVRLKYFIEEKDIEDNIEKTISYADVYQLVETEMKRPRKLLETVAFELISKIRDRWPGISSGVVTISKINPPLSGITGKAEVSLSF